MMTIKNINNPFGQDWLDKLRQLLPTIERLNITENRLLIDGNRKALFITGHKTKNSIAHFSVTKIFFDGNELKIKTTVLTPYLFMGIIFPIIAILSIWITNKSNLFSSIGTLMFIWFPIYQIRDILKQDKFSGLIKEEIERQPT